MQPVYPLRNPIRDYAWGSRTAIAELLGRAPAEEPQAELWLGAHPSASSEILVDEQWHRLDRWLPGRESLVLGPEVAARWGHLPFLMKVLAAARPLSIQAHPDAAQAQAGFAAEEAAGVPRDATERNYPDDRHKPEIIYALTDFSVLRGFRQPDDILRRLQRAGLGDSVLAAAVAWPGEDGTRLRALLDAFLGLDAEAAGRCVDRALSEAAQGRLDDGSKEEASGDAAAWMPKLADEYGRDRGVLAPLFLHVRTLAPGEAMYTGAGVLHAYLEGLGIEVMASSDNVLRGALTAKHVDPQELARVVRYEPGAPELTASTSNGIEQTFDTPADDFRLSVLRLGGDEAQLEGGVQILLCTEGEGVARAGTDELPFRELAFRRGDSFLVPHVAGPFALAGQAKLFRARVANAA